MRDVTKALLILTVLPIFMAILAALTVSRWFVLAMVFPLVVVAMAMSLGGRPRIMIKLNVDRYVMYVNDELKIKIEVEVNGGFGLLILRAPPAPKSSMAGAFEVIKGTNVHVAFKGLKNLHRRFEYTLRAVKRGEYALEGVEYLYYSGLGIHEPIRDFVEVKDVVKVLPRIKIVRRVLGIAKPNLGIPRYSSSRLGPYSMEFKAVREYVVGDPYRFINWKATARSPGGKLMVNEYEREGLRTAIIIIDVGWWMRYGTAEENPLEYGVSLVLSLSRALLRYGYNVGLWTIPMGPRVIPSSGMDQYNRLLRVLMTVKAFPIRGYVVDEALLRIVQETRPVIILITNVTKENVSKLSSMLKLLPSKVLIVDASPDLLLMRGIVKNAPCTNWFIRSRNKLYSLLPRNTKVISWNLTCEGVGLVMARVFMHIGRWS
nr:MAG: PepX protein [Vulcanisaeta sp. AZ3]